MPYILVNSRLGTTLDVPHSLDVLREYGGRREVELRRSPGSQVAYLVGDGIWSPTVIELSFRLVAVSEAAARSTLASIVRFALAATSLRRDAVAHRALQGVIAGEPSLAGVVARPVALLPHVWDVTLELLPRFEFWTTAAAETPAAYTAALAAQQEVLF